MDKRLVKLVSVTLLLGMVLSIARSWAASPVFEKTSLKQAQEAYTALTGKDTEIPVVVFVASWCSYCRALEQDLKRSGVPYARGDIEKDAKAQALYQRFGLADIGGVPVTVVGEQIVPGYQPEQIFAEINRMKELSKSSGAKAAVVEPA